MTRVLHEVNKASRLNTNLAGGRGGYLSYIICNKRKLLLNDGCEFDSTT